MFCDNISSIKMAKNPVFHARTKHIECQYHFVREKVMSNEISTDIRCYASMITDCMISAEHYTCMVDLLGHAGHQLEAENFINAMPCKPHAAMWKTLLGACIIHGNVEMGERVAKHVLELEPENAAVYLLLSRIYAVVGNRHLCDNVEQQRKEKGVRKHLGRTCIEVNNEVHTFVVDDWDHPQMTKIHAEL